MVEHGGWLVGACTINRAEQERGPLLGCCYPRSGKYIICEYLYPSRDQSTSHHDRL